MHNNAWTFAILVKINPMNKPAIFFIVFLFSFLGLAQNPTTDFLGSLNQQELSKTILAFDDRNNSGSFVI